MSVVDANENENDSQAPVAGRQFILFNAVPSWLVSAILHFLLVVLLAFWDLPGTDKTLVQILTETSEQEEVEDVEDIELTPTNLPTFDASESLESPITMDTEFSEQIEEMESFSEEPVDFSAPTDALGISDLLANADTGVTAGGGPAFGRGEKGREQALKSGESTEDSEQAVVDALNWIVNHQLPDGGWSFDHTIGPGAFRRSTGAGSARNARFGATAMAILPLLGAGQTHLEGEQKYKNALRRGLSYLIENQKKIALPGGGVGGSFHEPDGNMYSHGLATIALCEAYAMSLDRDLQYPAQAAINFIVYAQDDVTGGWLYQPRSGGDTSVVGWQFMALKSGQMGFLNVPKRTIGKATQFLDGVQTESGSRYGYRGPGGGSSTTSIGLLCRMYLGWDKENPALENGVEYLGGVGPSKNNMYYNYYATQVMRHYGGEPWKKWNGAMRDYVVGKQDKAGNTKGSWFFDHGWSKRGGRLYDTSMSCMILEVYYRHLPIYGSKAAEEEFALD